MQEGEANSMAIGRKRRAYEELKSQKEREKKHKKMRKRIWSTIYGRS